MAKRVHIKIADRGWILEKCASEIASRANNVSYGTNPDSSADLQYYINYSARSRRVSQTEVAFFTHSEFDEEARRRYFNSAGEVEHCVCMSERYARELIDSGIPAEKVTTIAPGVDLDEFRPKVRIGVVGRTYHTGRKGEALVAQVMDTPGIEWRFTGSGWPGASVHVPDGGMADFYNDLDYVLIPSLYEGGPMSVLEGLACGVPIISSDVGWVSEYPHIPFENGDAESLRKVLTGLVAEREALRSSVQDRTWDAWADEHLRLFDRLLGGGFASAATAPSNTQQFGVTLITHGSERTTQGGPSVRVPWTAAALREIGIAANSAHFPGEAAQNGDLVHLFNIWPPRSSVEAARALSNAGKQLVFSPILLDLREIDFWQRRMLELTSRRVDTSVLQRLESEYSERTSWSARRDPEPGFTSRVRELAELSDALIFLSKREKALFQEMAGEHDCTALIHNPVDTTRFGGADPKLFRDLIGLDDFILCVGRIEPRKNQLFLVAAAKQLGLPVVLVGHSGGNGYAEAVASFGGDGVRLVGRIDPASDLLRSAYAACRVFALPSWAEGAPLAALEAAASGANMVLSSRSGEEEYFGELARYADPSSIEELSAQLSAAWNDPDREDRSQAVRQKVKENNSVEEYAKQTAALYREVLKREPRSASAHPPADSADAAKSKTGPIFVELSTTLNAKEVTGINRVEAFVSRRLAEIFPERAKFVVWDHPTNLFIEVPRDIVLDGGVRDFVESGAGRTISQDTTLDGQLLVMGSGWLQNSRYAEAMGALAGSYGLELTMVIHDIIPALRPHWFPERYAPVFVENLRAMLSNARRVLTYSENTAKDVRQFATENAISCPPIFRFRLANEIEAAATDDQDEDQPFSDHAFTRSNFILSVGAIHKRKNYDLLYDCWVELKERFGASCPHLVIVGGVGWDGRDTARALTEDPRLAGLVHILTGVADDGLAWLYRHCLFTVYPSLYEGWGLPVAESLAAGKVVLASNTSSVPEIAPQLCELIDPQDRTAWVSKILHYTLSASSRMQRESRIGDEFAPVAWADTVEGIVEALGQPITPDRHRRLYNSGDVISLSTAAGRRHKSYGWHLTERFGSWAAARHAGLRLVLRPNPSKDLTLAATLQVFGRGGPVRVSANGETIARWDIPAGSEVLRFARIPKALVRDDGALDLDFESPRVTAVRALNPKSGDARSLGLGLWMVQLVEDVSEELWNGITVLQPLPVDQPIPLAEGGAFVHAPGFHGAEPDGMWSKFKESALTFRLAEPGPLVLRLEVWAPLAGSANARIVVKSGDRTREVRLRGGGNEVVFVPLAPSTDGICSVDFVVDSMFVPSLHRGSEDKRELGILVRSIAALKATEEEVPRHIAATDATPRRFWNVVRGRARRLARLLRGWR